MIVILGIIGGCIYFACPLVVQLILSAINFFVPDPIPILDEAIMVGGILVKLYKMDNLLTEIKWFASSKKGKIILTLGILLIVVVAVLVVYLVTRSKG